MFKTLLTLAVATQLSGCIVYLDDENGGRRLEHTERSLTLDTSGLTELRAHTEAGSLEIRGVSGLAKVEVIADIYSRSADDALLTLEERNGRAVLSAGFGRGGENLGNSRIDLLVRVPANFELDVEDGSGHITIHGVAGVELDDGSGHIEIEDISGNVRVKDGSGHLSISHVGGVVTVDDGSGNITINDAGGLTLLDSGSGGLRLTSISGPMEIDE